jgi:hypothetical protein
MSKQKKAAERKSARIGLNSVALLVAIVGISYPLFTQSPQGIAQNAVTMVGAVGADLTVGVAPNPYNTEAQALAQKQLSLQEREAQLNTREAADTAPQIGAMLGFVSFFLSLLLCALVGLNFYLDSRRGRKLSPLGRRFQVDLR